MKILNLGAINFLGYKELALDLTKLEPLTLIDGRNYDYSAVSANGAGKSSIPEAVCYALFGRTIRNLEVKHGKDAIIREGAKGGATVWAEAELPTGLLRVEHYRQHPEYQNKVRAWLDGKDVVRGRTAADTDARIEQLLGFDYDLFKRAVVIHSRLTESFSTLENRYIKQITERLLGLRDFDGLRKFVVDQVTKAEADRVVAERALESGKEQLTQAEQELAGLIVKQRNYAQEVKDQRTRLKGMLAETAAKIAQLKIDMAAAENAAETASAALTSLEKAQAAARQGRSDVEANRARTDRRLAALQADLKGISNQQKRYSNMEGKECPECGQDVPASHIKQRVAELNKLAANLDDKMIEAKKALRIVMDELTKIDEQTAAYDQELATARQAANKADRAVIVLAEQVKTAVIEHKRLTQQQDELASNPYDELAAQKRTQAAKLESRMRAYGEEAKAQDERKRYLAFWAFAFGPAGVRSFMLDGATPVLNKLANFYLEQLTDNTMGVTLNTIKPNKDGTYRDQFDIDVTNESGGSALGSASDGELACVDVALNLAISDMLSNRVPGGIGLLFLDQVADLVDEARAALVIRLLRQKTDTAWCAGQFAPKDHIFLISHREDIKDAIGSKLIVEKKDGICRLAV